MYDEIFPKMFTTQTKYDITFFFYRFCYIIEVGNIDVIRSWNISMSLGHNVKKLISNYDSPCKNFRGKMSRMVVIKLQKYCECENF